MTTAENLAKIGENVEKVYNSGKKAANQSFWDTYQLNGNRTNYAYSFRTGWRDEIFDPKYPIVCNGNNSATNMFSYAAVSDTKMPISISGNNASVFYYATALVTVPLLTIRDVPSMSDWFIGCTRLKNLTIDGEIKSTTGFPQSTELTAKSIVSIVKHLSDTATNQSVSFSATAVAGGDWTETEYENWEALVAIKPNWTFTLS